jgi:hypothetical protein
VDDDDLGDDDDDFVRRPRLSPPPPPLRGQRRRGRVVGSASGNNATATGHRRALLQSNDNPYNLGATLVHEVGHWLGLEHTFEGGCSQTNDGVGDTPAIREPTSGCPLSRRDTCPNMPGADQFENYMDYSDDRCMNLFTRGQIERMVASYEGLRLGR